MSPIQQVRNVGLDIRALSFKMLPFEKHVLDSKHTREHII